METKPEINMIERTFMVGDARFALVKDDDHNYHIETDEEDWVIDFSVFTRETWLVSDCYGRVGYLSRYLTKYEFSERPLMTRYHLGVTDLKEAMERVARHYIDRLALAA
jgi:hypothetical protein